MDFDYEGAEDFLERGKTDLILEKYSAAIENLTRAIEIFPDDKFYSEKLFVAYYARGLAYKKSDKYLDAVEDFRRALDYNFDSAEAWYKLGVCYQVLYGCDFAELAFSHVERLKNY